MFNLPFLFIALILFFIWALLFFFGKNTRREQIIMSLAGLVLTPAVLMVASNDYRVTGTLSYGLIGVEDLIFAFSFTGVAAVVYEILIGRRLVPARHKHLWGKHPINWFASLVIILGSWALVSMAALWLFPVNSVYALMVGGLLVLTYIITDRHDLIFDALFSGLFMAILVFGLEQLFFVQLFPTEAAAIWQVDRLSGFLPGGVPVEEIIWVLIVGMAIGPVYEFVRHYRVK
ncbi:MAG: lycopene cyclase domain-containing protein [Patescibacteria group bacterium]|jgi:hypothetical protein